MDTSKHNDAAACEMKSLTIRYKHIRLVSYV